ncbi:solute carrier family 26 [Seminavis robusta]|uniref:Solute carrier family 26 n=1 Tax=Seminavis robusta TaxID=568900 RepID=A0A9N8EKK5_9STRA|nr:solute carrier family 26 [Seminavis robusta]|eukprot:Sro1232_g254710.1 solute carrier family 26 (930) ;mRNA; r:18890-22122
MASRNSDLDPLLQGGVRSRSAPVYGSALKNEQDEESQTKKFKMLSTGDNRDSTASVDSAAQTKGKAAGASRFIYYIIYALVNVIISAPGLYGYAAVIFNHPVYNEHMNALSKLVIFSSLIHQLGFLLFSTLDFAIGTVQDAGLIFLSAMANKIADTMLEDGRSTDEILTTTIVLLSAGTALLGICLIIVGRFGLADAVSYLPMPVVGGYLAYIGYFCCQAGVALCISTPLITVSDWAYLFDPHNLLLAIPGLGAGLILTLASRKISNDAALPLIMVAIPASFYVLLWITGESLESAREAGWVGQVAPPVPVSDLFKLIDLELVHWSLATEILPTWCGMVFVVSFASCLDVAAISIDMGEALDTNHELATVGICNLMSGLTMGFTGSYIFSQTIFTYRTGVHSRWIGALIMVVFFYIVVSEVNVLQIAPLFFLGSTLIFIGYDLLFEWLWEIRHQVFITEYGIVILTFLAIQVVGIDGGIVVGVLVAVVDHVVLTATSTTITKVHKRSRAIWSPEENKILHNHAYNINNCQNIVTLELTGTIFFGSALQSLNRIVDETYLNQDTPAPGPAADVMHSPRTPHAPALSGMTRRTTQQQDRVSISSPRRSQKGGSMVIAQPAGRPPKYLVLDLLYVTHLDASATRGCFLQLVKIAAKQGIVVCASGVTPRIEWMFRTHGVAYPSTEESAAVKARLCSRNPGKSKPKVENALLFVSVQDALEFCENALLHEYKAQRHMPMPIIPNLVGPVQQSFTSVLGKILGASEDEKQALSRLEDERYHEERVLKSGEILFQLNEHSDAFYVVLQGCVANNSGTDRAVGRLKQKVFSGAGRVGSKSNLLDPVFLAEQEKAGTSDVAASLWYVGSVVGFLDFLLNRPRLFRLVATGDNTMVAKVSQSNMNLMKAEDPELHALVTRVLLNAAASDLANSTYNDE